MSDVMSLVRIDLENMRPQLRMLSVLAVIVVALSFLGNGGVAVPMLAALSVMMGLAPVSAESQYNLGRIFGTLPVARRSVVAAHYITAVGSTVAVLLLDLVAGVAAAVVRHEDVAEVAAGVLLTLAILVLMLALYTPAIIKWGSRSAGLVLLLVFGLFAVVGAVLFQAGGGSSTDGTVNQQITFEPSMWQAVGGALVAAVVLLAVSYFVSVRIYERQDH